MNAIVPPDRKQWAGQRIAISLKAALLGWLAFLAFLALMLGINAIFGVANGTSSWVAFLLIAAGSGFTVFVVWIVVLIPIALLIPDRSVLWEPRFLALIGAVAGPLIVLVCGVYNLEQNPTIQPQLTYLAMGIVFPGIPSAIIGGVTGAVAAQLRKRSLEKKTTSI